MNKYGARKTTVDGITFDSKHEAEIWCELKLMERAGIIKDLERQVRIELIPKTSKFRATYYVADFKYYDNRERRPVIMDAKGVRTKEYMIKKKLLYWRYGIEIKEE